MSVKALSDAIGLSLAGVSRSIEAMVQRGDVKRAEDPRDRRSKLLTATPRRPQALRAPARGPHGRRAPLRRRIGTGRASGPRPGTGRGGREDSMTGRIRLNEGNRRWWTLAAMCFALFMLMLDNTVVNVALPSIQDDLGASLSGLEWTVNVYTLTFAVLLVTGGRLGDILGRRRMFLFGVVVFAVSSAAIGFAPDEGWLIGFRAVQGVGAAFMMPATLSIITVTFPAEERGKAIGTWAGVSALALAIGPVVGGALTEYVSWRAIFFLNLPVAVGAVIVTLFADARVARRDARAQHRLERHRRAVGRPDRARARADRGQLLGLGLRPRHRPAGRGRRRLRGLRPDRAARARADGRVLAVPLEDVPRRERRRLHRLVRDARDVLLPRALHAEHPRLLARSRRACASSPPR